eukprot:TRINITY_DN7139_c0_g2_i2.p1 TRINITY_DN7139_c0_g2~~TRINITY_DN7139_c0_g2_i2.p1  ORF type:complete len:229 (+),score=43.94 TRINITY_DN7139_c0_g2_i2:249-935(+)
MSQPTANSVSVDARDADMLDSNNITLPFTDNEHQLFLQMVHNSISSHQFFIDPQHSINGRSINDISNHAKAWISSLINNNNSDTNPRSINTNSDAPNESSKKRKHNDDDGSIKQPVYSLDFFPQHILQTICKYLSLPYLHLLKSVSKKFYFLSKVEIRSMSPPKSLNEHFGYTAEFAGNGHLSCLKYAHENGCDWDEATCSGAIRNGQKECLKYALLEIFVPVWIQVR